MRQLVMLVGIALTWVGCGGDDVSQGLRDECATFGGAGLDCEKEPIDSIEDACAKLLACGVIPLENPNGGFDWEECMDLGDDLDDLNRATVFSCIEVSSCDELRSDGNTPLCLQHGN